MSKKGRNYALPTSRPLQQQVYAKCRQLLADGLVSCQLNFFRLFAIVHNCPVPATYAGFVFHNTNFWELLLSWFNTHHTMAVTLFNFLFGDLQRYNTLPSSSKSDP
ncbi:hypothetical protein P9112_007536 [Eukaryota sp. TZLM1-RC]